MLGLNQSWDREQISSDPRSELSGELSTKCCHVMVQMVPLSMVYPLYECVSVPGIGLRLRLHADQQRNVNEYGNMENTFSLASPNSKLHRALLDCSAARFDLL
ncbi:uncharacterized protein LOC113565623 isoform X2 [Drosophila persimilis]|uniref:uncharacterized protein LOC113565623 isoform X2 n=1 Tax=Drosophila persimilis TaxID=7234 RepID=UPI000708862B|nr:uncharacterized protein LOC113565623 isoform X2 [Drosophila persimilis]